VGKVAENIVYHRNKKNWLKKTIAQSGHPGPDPGGAGFEKSCAGLPNYFLNIFEY
jgi:hypothetical protein